MSRIDGSQQPLKFIVGDRSLIFLQQFPLRRIGQRITEMIRRGYGRGPGREAEVKEEEEPLVKMARDHGLDFRLFNTMLAGC